MTGDRPVVVVLQPEGSRRARPLIEQRAEVRYASPRELAGALPGADVLTVFDVTGAEIAPAWHAADRLSWVHTDSAGVDSVLFDALVDSTVTVTNARGVYERTIAEFVLAYVLAFAKDVPGSLELQRQQRWLRRDTETIDGAHAMIVGPGAIGRAIARMLTAVGMTVSGVGRTARDGDPDFGVIHADTALAQVAGQADYLVVIAPLTARTRGMIDARVLTAMAPHARLINVGRGASVVTEDLLAAVRAPAGDPARIAGAALDVVDPEPLPAGHPLWTAPNVLISFHMAGDTAGWTDRLDAALARRLDAFIAGGTAALADPVDKTRGFVG